MAISNCRGIAAATENPVYLSVTRSTLTAGVSHLRWYNKAVSRELCSDYTNATVSSITHCLAFKTRVCSFNRVWGEVMLKSLLEE